MLDTIFALATGSAVSAVCVVRVSGPRAADVGRRFASTDLAPRRAHFVRVADPRDGELIDTGLAIFFPGPASFTGEDCVEFQLHGSRAVIARMLDALAGQDGLRMAKPGEFIRRAFQNGKMALTSVEGAAELLEARTDWQRRQALSQASGALAIRAAAWREHLIDALALLAAEIDFADEGEAPTNVLHQVREIIQDLRSDFEAALSDAKRAAVIRNGFRIVLCGPPNAGKSTLLNALARRDVAIVTEHAGTTRDVIEIELDLRGIPVVVCDTAGIRPTTDVVEAIGIERSLEAMANADLAVWVGDAVEGRPALPDGTASPMLTVANKIDQVASVPAWCDVGVSARDGSGLPELIDSLAGAAESFVGGEMPLVTNARQRACVEVASRHANSAMAWDERRLEIVAEELRLCAHELEALLGRVPVDDILGAVFSRFCMGK